MKVTDKIVAKINRIDTGDVFGYDTLGLTSDEIIAGSKALSRLVDKGELLKELEKVIIINQKFPFGEQKPREDVLLSLYLFEKTNKLPIYIYYGTRLYNRLRLTTQVPNSHTSSILGQTS